MKWNNSYKDKFLLDELFMLSISGAFQRNRIYSINAEDQSKKDFKKLLRTKVESYLPQYIISVTDEHHIQNISDLKSDIDTSEFNIILKCNEISFGTCQKLLNLFLKYCWTINKIQEPPHCPVDRIILNEVYKTTKKQYPNWTTASADDYSKCLEDIKIVSAKQGMTIGQWEMSMWNRR